MAADCLLHRACRWGLVGCPDPHKESPIQDCSRSAATLDLFFLYVRRLKPSSGSNTRNFNQYTAPQAARRAKCGNQKPGEYRLWAKSFTILNTAKCADTSQMRTSHENKTEFFNGHNERIPCITLAIARPKTVPYKIDIQRNSYTVRFCAKKFFRKPVAKRWIIVAQNRAAIVFSAV